MVDAVMLGLLGLCTQWVVPAPWLAHGDSWVLALTGFASVGYQCHTEIVWGAVTTLIVMGGNIGGLVIAPPNATMFTAVWATVAAALSRVQWILGRPGDRRTDGRRRACPHRAAGGRRSPCR